MRSWLLIMMLLMLPLSASAKLYVIVVQGLGGDEYYSAQFDEQTKKLTRAVSALTGKDQVTVLTGKEASRDNILAHFNKLQKTVTASDRMALFLIGHGSFDGQLYKFNIPGPDLTGEDIVKVLQASAAKQQLLVNTSSASGEVLKDLKGDSRIIITATRNGNERNAPHFGGYFINALDDHSADTNKNDAISAEEAFTYAERMTQDYYKNEGRLATEHPQLDGKLATQFTIARLTPGQETSTSPAVARLLEQRREIDQKIDDLQSRKNEFKSADDYYNQLQDLLLQLSRLEEQLDRQNAGPAGKPDNDVP